MALTQGTTAPICPAPFNMGGSAQTAHVMAIPCKASETYRIGDIVVLASGVADAVDAAQTDGTILGVAIQAKTAGGTVSSTDTVQLALATPGTFFQGSLVGGAATDLTPSATPATAAALALATTTDTVLGTDAYSAFLLIDQTDTSGGQIRMIRISPNQMRGQTFTLGSQVIKNPRMDFVFRCSAFQPLA